MIPFVDLKAQYLSIKDEIDAAVAAVIENGRFVLGDEGVAFEAEFAAYCGVKHCIGVGSGTAALQLALKACDVGPGDEVITVSHTFIATASAVSWTGATPVFVDIDPMTYTMDVEQAAAAISPRTKAILPVHLYGQCADMDPLLALAQEHDLWVVEDACQAHGATYKGRKAGSMGHLGCFSFYPSKNLGAFGDAGAMVTNDQELAKRVRLLRNHGQVRKCYHDSKGYNSRLDEIQAAVLRVKLRCLDEWNAARRQVAAQYNELLHDSLQIPRVRAENEHVYHLYVIASEQRDALQRHLRARGIETLIHYPVPIHCQTAYARQGDFKVISSLTTTEQVAGRVLSLPMYPELSRCNVQYGAQAISDFHKDYIAALSRYSDSPRFVVGVTTEGNSDE